MSNKSRDSVDNQGKCAILCCVAPWVDADGCDLETILTPGSWVEKLEMHSWWGRQSQRGAAFHPVASSADYPYQEPSKVAIANLCLAEATRVKDHSKAWHSVNQTVVVSIRGGQNCLRCAWQVLRRLTRTHPKTFLSDGHTQAVGTLTDNLDNALQAIEGHPQGTAWQLR